MFFTYFVSVHSTHMPVLHIPFCEISFHTARNEHNLFPTFRFHTRDVQAVSNENALENCIVPAIRNDAFEVADALSSFQSSRRGKLERTGEKRGVTFIHHATYYHFFSEFPTTYHRYIGSRLSIVLAKLEKLARQKKKKSSLLSFKNFCRHER